MRFTEEQLNYLYWYLDDMNNDPNGWYYLNDDKTEVIMRKAKENTADGWGEEEIITDQVVEQAKQFIFWGE